MEIKELKGGMGNIYIKLKCISKGGVRVIDTERFQGEVCSIICEDSNKDKIECSLWKNKKTKVDEISKIDVGDTFEIKNGYCRSFVDENDNKEKLSVTSGRFGRLVKDGE